MGGRTRLSIQSIDGRAASLRQDSFQIGLYCLERVKVKWLPKVSYIAFHNVANTHFLVSLELDGDLAQFGVLVEVDQTKVGRQG